MQKFNSQKQKFWIAIPLLAVFWFNPASAMTVDGIAVGGAGSSFTSEVGNTSGGKIKYYIPLDNNKTGTYGALSGPCTKGIGTCSDSGSGTGYNAADGLAMNIYFELSGPDPIDSASLEIKFDDLDLGPDNDPTGFFESLSFSYWGLNGTATDFDPSATQVGTTIKMSSELASGAFGGGNASYALGDIDPSDPNITWNLDLAALGLLQTLNDSKELANGFWVQLGFGSQFSSYGGNTPEYLSASLSVAPVPVPAAVWLFGTAIATIATTPGEPLVELVRQPNGILPIFHQVPSRAKEAPHRPVVRLQSYRKGKPGTT